MNILKSILLFAWQYLQHLLGIILYVIYDTDGSDTCKYKITNDNDKVLAEALVLKSTKMKSGISLGEFIIVHKNASPTTIMHELGHSRQSKYLGPLYLFVIGIPSLLNNLYNTITKGGSAKYYKFFTEKWADKLGGVVRK